MEYIIKILYAFISKSNNKTNYKNIYNKGIYRNQKGCCILLVDKFCSRMLITERTFTELPLQSCIHDFGATTINNILQILNYQIIFYI